MPSEFLPPKICPLMSGPSGLGGTSLEDCTSRCALYDRGACALLAFLRREPSPPGSPMRPKPTCDRDALLALTDEMGRNTRNMLSDDKVDASDIWYYEHLLRKALGEVAS